MGWNGRMVVRPYGGMLFFKVLGWVWGVGGLVDAVIGRTAVHPYVFGGMAFLRRRGGGWGWGGTGGWLCAPAGGCCF